MTDFTFKCPHCKQHLEADDSMSGQSVDCPACNKTLVVPTRQRQPKQHPPRPQQRPAPPSTVPQAPAKPPPAGIPVPKVIALVVVCSAVAVFVAVAAVFALTRKSESTAPTASNVPSVTRRVETSTPASTARTKAPEPTVSPEERAKDEIRRCINGLMREQDKGNIGTRYWESEILAKQFFTPTSWDILDIAVGGDFANAKVRIESSTKGGMPIRNLWTFYMSNKNGWKVSILTGD